MPSGGLSVPTPAERAAARMLMTTGNNTYSHLAMRHNTTDQVRRSNAQTKLERLRMMVKGIMGYDPVVQTEVRPNFLDYLAVKRIHQFNL